ncbi:hypothetical protein ACWEV4_12570 [Streptomyces sp. NPDC003860]
MSTKSTRSAMRELRDDLAHALEQAGPDGPDDVFAALCARLSERRGRPVVLRLVEFPPGTASGLYLDMTDQDVICVQANTQPSHQLVIFGHEVWHMMAGHGGGHTDLPGGAVPPPEERAPSVGTAAAVQGLAARTDFHQRQETEAETFGLELGAQLRSWLEGTAGRGPRSELARRIHTSLGNRRAGRAG